MKKIILILSCLSISLYAFADGCNAPKDDSSDQPKDDATVQSDGTQGGETTPAQE